MASSNYTIVAIFQPKDFSLPFLLEHKQLNLFGN